MASVMITCPTTQKPVNTGIGATKEAFDDPKTVMQKNGASCPHCGQMHVWSREDAYLEGDKPK